MDSHHHFNFSSLGSELQELEEERKKVLRLMQFSFTGSLLFFILLVSIVFNVDGLLRTFAGIILMGFLMLIIFVIIKPVLKKQREFKLKYRKLIVEKLINKIDPNIIYDPAGFVSEAHFMASDIYDAYTEDYYGGNYFKLELQDYSVEFSEVTAYDAEGGGNKDRKLVFSGLIYVFKWDKSLNGRTVIATDKGLGAFGFITNYFESKKFEGYKRWEAPHQEFERLFQVYSNNHQETATILDQNFLETMISLRNTHPRGIQISLGAKNLYVLINAEKKYFNPKTDEKVDNAEQLKRYYTELQEILEVVYKIQPIIKAIK